MGCQRRQSASLLQLGIVMSQLMLDQCSQSGGLTDLPPGPCQCRRFLGGLLGSLEKPARIP
jgi:hypothetical protein